MRLLRVPVAVVVCLVLAACGGAPSAAQISAAPSPSGERAPAFPELTGDVRAPVHLLSFDPAGHAVVVEPIIFMTGRDYCTTYGVSAVDSRCSQEIYIENSNTRVTLPLAAKPDLRDIGEGECLGTLTEGADCKATAKDMTRLAESSAEVVVTLRSGEVVRIAQLFQP